MQTLLGKKCKALAVLTLALLYSPVVGKAATFTWEPLNDRERITITLEPNDGLPGGVARVGKESLILPFTQVPPATIIPKTPEKAKLFAKTEPLGNALAIITQSPNFGFVVTKRTPTLIVVELFPDSMGSRWKRPAEVAPTTELPPQDAVDEALKNAAQTTEPVAEALAVQQPAQTVVPAPTAAPVVELPAAATNTPAPSAVTAPAQQPSALALPSQQPNAPVEQPIPLPAAAEQTPPEKPKAFLDARKDTAPRTAPLPTVLPGQTPLTQPTAPATGQPTAYTSSTPNAVPPDHTVVPAGNLGLAIIPPSTGAPSSRGVNQGVPASPMSAAPQVSEVPPTGASAQIPSSGAALMAQATAVQSTNSPASPVVASSSVLGATAQAASAVPTAAAPAASAVPTAAAPAASAVPTAAAPTVQAASAVPTAAAPTMPAASAAATVTPSAPAAPILPYFGMEDEELPVGSAVFAGPGVMYRALANHGGADKLQAPSAGKVAEATVKQIEPAASGDLVKGAATVTPHDVPPVGHEPEKKEPPVAEAPAKAPTEGHSAPSAEASEKAAPNGEHGAATADAAGAVVYQDEQGNVIEPPVDPAQLLPEITMDIAASKFQVALDKLEKLLKQSNLNNDQRETALHMQAEAYFALHQNDLETQGYKIIEYAKVAMNFNPSSTRNAAELLRIGFVNLKLKNIPEAEAHFNILRKQFPNDVNVPLTYYYWGDYFFNKDELQKAADQFEHVLTKYPNSQYTREAALGAARSFYKMGYFQKSFDVADYIEKRWSHFYLDYPPFLNMMGDVAFRLDKLDYALRHYWLYVNIEPKGQETDMILARIGDIYSAMRFQKLAAAVYRECKARFPDKDGGLISRMRLSEASVNDDPSIDDMLSVFRQPNDESPRDVYVSIIHDFPTSNLAPLAELKLAMWHLWKHDYLTALDTCSNFVAKYPKHELLPKVKEVALTAFATMASESASGGPQYRIQEIWTQYPIVQDQSEILPPEGRLGLAINFWKNGEHNAALKQLDPFFYGNKVEKYSELALQLALNIYLDLESWPSIITLAQKVELWELSPPMREQLDFSLALSYENLNNSATAATLWRKLYESGSLPAPQLAYAAYFLAQDAVNAGDLEKANLLGSDALERLMTLPDAFTSLGNSEKIKSLLLSLITVSEKAGRFPEALDFAQRYLQLLTPDAPGRDGVLYQMARIYKKQGNDEAWKNQLTELVEKYPESVLARSAAFELRSTKLQNDISQFSPVGNQ